MIIKRNYLNNEVPHRLDPRHFGIRDRIETKPQGSDARRFRSVWLPRQAGQHKGQCNLTKYLDRSHLECSCSTRCSLLELVPGRIDNCTQRRQKWSRHRIKVCFGGWEILFSKALESYAWHLDGTCQKSTKRGTEVAVKVTAYSIWQKSGLKSKSSTKDFRC